MTSSQCREEAVGCPGQRGSWMPSKIFSIRPAKFLTTFFYQLSNFRTIRTLGAPSRAASCPGNDILLFVFCHLPTFFNKNWHLGYPPGWMPGTVRPPLCKPLWHWEPDLNLCIWIIMLHKA